MNIKWSQAHNSSIIWTQKIGRFFFIIIDFEDRCSSFLQTSLFSIFQFFLGGLLTWWKRKFGLCKELDTLYGKTPNAATFDPTFREKCLITHHNGKFPVFDGNNNRKVVNWTNFMRVLQEEVKVWYGLRSSKEPRHLHRDSFE